jgi:voltage-gated potassium channel
LIKKCFNYEKNKNNIVFRIFLFEMHSVMRRIRYLFTAWTILEILSLVTLYISLILDFVSFDQTVKDSDVLSYILPPLYMFSFLRFFRYNKHGKQFLAIKNVIIKKRKELVLSTLFFFFLILLVATTMYLIERVANPTYFGSIPRSFYYTIVMLTTIGFGDVTASTLTGKIFTIIFAILPAFIIAIPTSSKNKIKG